MPPITLQIKSRCLTMVHKTFRIQNFLPVWLCLASTYCVWLALLCPHSTLAGLQTCHVCHCLRALRALFLCPEHCVQIISGQYFSSRAEGFIPLFHSTKISSTQPPSYSLPLCISSEHLCEIKSLIFFFVYLSCLLAPLECEHHGEGTLSMWLMASSYWCLVPVGI